MSQENVEVVRRWWGGFNDDGMPPLSLCDEQIEIRMPPDFPVRGLFQGHEGVRRWREQVFEVAENARVEPEEIVDVHDDGETVLMLLRATGTAELLGGQARHRVGGDLDDSGREAAACPGLPEPSRSPRSRRAFGVGDVAGERGDRTRSG